jgi:hypothetical protein
MDTCAGTGDKTQGDRRNQRGGSHATERGVGRVTRQQRRRGARGSCRLRSTRKERCPRIERVRVERSDGRRSPLRLSARGGLGRGRPLSSKEVLHEAAHHRRHRESVLRAPSLERRMLLFGQANGKGLMLSAGGNDRHRRRPGRDPDADSGRNRLQHSGFQRPRRLHTPESEIEPRSEQEPHNYCPISLGESVQRLLN